MPRSIETGGRFRRDLKREMKGQHGPTLEADLGAVVKALANDQPLATRFKDHGLAGEWRDHRDCHVKPDLVLICRLPNRDSLQLVRLGSHAELEL